MQQSQPNKPRAKSGFFGVYESGRQRWQAKLRHNGREHHFGTYNTKQEAAAAYDKATRKRKGANAVCNFATQQEADAAGILAATEWERENLRICSCHTPYITHINIIDILRGAQRRSTEINKKERKATGIWDCR